MFHQAGVLLQHTLPVCQNKKEPLSTYAKGKRVISISNCHIWPLWFLKNKPTWKMQKGTQFGRKMPKETLCIAKNSEKEHSS